MMEDTVKLGLSDVQSIWYSLHTAIKILNDQYTSNSSNERTELLLSLLDRLPGAEFKNCYSSHFRDQESTKEDEYSAFTTWLLGQLVFVLTKDIAELLHISSTEAQKFILESVLSRNPCMFIQIVSSYLVAIEDLLKFYKKLGTKHALTDEVSINSGTSQTFKWFVPNAVSTLPDCFDLEQHLFIINSASQCTRLLDQLLKILSSQVFSIANLCEDLWPLVLSILDNCHEAHVRLITLDVVIQLLQHSGYPKNNSLKNIFFQMLEQLLKQMCIKNCEILEKDKSWSHIMKLMNQVAIMKGTGSNLENMSLLNTLFTVINNENISLLPNAFLISLSNFIKYLLDETPEFLENSPKLDSLFFKLSSCPHLFMILEYIFLKKLNLPHSEKCSNQELEIEFSSMQKINTKTIYNINAIWNKAVNIMEENVFTKIKYNGETFDANSHLSHENKKSLRLLYFFCKTISSLSFEIDNRNKIAFLNGKLGDILKCLMYVLLKESNTDEDLLADSFFILNQVVTVSGISNEPSENIHLLAAFLSLPWVLNEDVFSKFSYSVDEANLSLLHAIGQKYQNKLSGVDLCGEQLKNLGYVSSNVCFQWRFTLYQIFSKDECFQRIIFESLPFMIQNCRGSNQGKISQFLHSIVESCESCPKTHSEFSRVLPSIICALSFNCILKRDSNVKLGMHCRTCTRNEVSTFVLDEESEEISEALRVFISSYYSDLIVAFIKKTTSEDPLHCTIRKNIISSIPYLTNHVPKKLCKTFLFASMEFMNDSNSDNRLEFSKAVKYTIFNNKWLKSVVSNKSCLRKWSLSDREVFKDAEPFYDEFKKVCLQAIDSSLQRTGKNKQISLMETLLNVGSVPCDCFLWSTVKMLMHYVAHPCKKDIYLSSCYIRQIIAAHNMNMNNFLSRYEGEILEEIIFQIVTFNMNFSTPLNKTLLDLCSLFALEMRDFVSHHGPNLNKYLLGYVARWKENQRLLQELAQLSVYSIEYFIIEGFKEIYPIIVLYQSKENASFCCKLMEKLSGLTIPVLIRRSFLLVLANLLVHYYAKAKEAEEAFLEIKKYDEKNYPDAADKQNEIAEFLQFRFLGLLGELEFKLTSQSTSDSIKAKILCSLPGIFNLMGSEYITSVRFKVLVTLCTALTLQQGYLPSLCIEAWHAFVNIVEVSALGPMLSTIFVSLFPLIEDYPTEISNIFYYLICENEEQLSGFFGELYFLEQHPANWLVYETVQKYLLPDTQMNGEHFRRLLKQASHERAEVRLQAFNRLKDELDFYHDEISKIILSSDSLDPLIIEILETLTVGSHDADERVRIACGKCFGELGAIDPGLLPNKLSDSDLTKNVPLKVDCESAVIHLLTTLCQGFQSAKLSRSQDEFALAIQEMLKIFSVQEESALLSNFPENFRELMKPLFKSTYNRKELDNPEVNLPFPIFGSTKGKTFQTWAFNWINHLVSLSKSQKIKEIFKNCKGSMRIDESTIRAFMPFIVVNSVIESNDMQRKQIYEELDYVMSNSGTEFLLSNGSKSGSIGFARQFIKPDYFQDYSVDTMNEISLNAQTCSILCAKVVYGLIDFLSQYTRDDSNQTKPEDRKIIGAFLNLFSKEKIAEKSFMFDEFPRALLYLEQFVAENPEALQTHLPLFGKIYAQLNDADAIQGIIAIHSTEPSAEEMLLMHEVTGGLPDAVVCYQKLAQKNDNNPLFYRSMVQCYLRIDQPFTALKLTENLISTSSDFDDNLFGEKVEAIWSMMMFDQLESVLSKPSVLKSESLGARMGVAMLHVLHNEEDKMLDEIRNMYKIISHSLYTSTLVSGGYREGYEYVIKLHILNEVEQLSSLVLSILNSENSDEEEDTDRLKKLIEKKFNKRLRLLQPLGDVLQPVLRIRRVMLSIGERLLSERKKQVASFFRDHIGKCLLKSIKIARKASNFQMAYSNILEVEKYKPKELFIEKAQLFWVKKEINQALGTLNRGIEIHFSNPETMLPAARIQEEKRIHAKAKLLIACYNEETSNIDSATNTKYFEETVKICNDIEKSYVRLAQFLDKTSISEFQSYVQIPERLESIIRSYGKSMLYGCKFLYQSMSKVLSLWLDFGADLFKDSKEQDQDSRRKRQEGGTSHRRNLNIERREKSLKNIIGTIGLLLERLPTFMFLAAFSQLTSRICHPDHLSFNLLKEIIIKCILAYPNQTLWMFMCLHRSLIPLRMKRFNIVLNDGRLKANPVAVLIPKFKRLFEVMSELCEKPVEGKYRGKSLSIDKIFPEFMKLFAAGTFNEIMIPFQKFRTLALPRPIEEDTFSLSEHKPFPDNCVYMQSLKKEITVLCSLQVPKKLTIIGSDGKEYSLLCKPKDDLRLDFRLMEFNSIVNMFLKRDGEARDRDLHIHTYSVAPLINDCGLIEWVPNLECLRPILNALYKSRNLGLSNAEVKKRAAAVKDPLEKKVAFLRDLKKHHPPILKEWFFKTFPNPCAWYLARLAYTRTLAVMSIVGFILGLGDRHTENILLDDKRGEIIHVDFNCLFNKGELFDYKEVVPFRLTHNLVDTMGPTGIEGAFVRCCEITNRIMRAHRQLLISVLTPFVYDPLLCWKGGRDGTSETVNTEAKNHINNIECRLKGSVKKKDGKYDDMQLSIEGQVRSLIQEATSEDNLAQMFPGWGPYL